MNMKWSIHKTDSLPSLFILLSKSLCNLSENGVLIVSRQRDRVYIWENITWKSSLSRQMNEIEEHSTACAAKHTVLLYFQTTLTHILLTAFQKTNLLSGSHRTQLIFAWKGIFSLVSLWVGLLVVPAVIYMRRLGSGLSIVKKDSFHVDQTCVRV